MLYPSNPAGSPCLLMTVKMKILRMIWMVMLFMPVVDDDPSRLCSP